MHTTSHNNNTNKSETHATNGHHTHTQHVHHPDPSTASHTDTQSSTAPPLDTAEVNNIHPSALHSASQSNGSQDISCQHFTTVFDSAEHASKYVTDLQQSKSYIRPLVFCGPSGVGKVSAQLI